MDVVVIGDGPGGLSAGLFLAKGGLISPSSLL
jgi:phytoene dehydrogenase-like protein